MRVGQTSIIHFSSRFLGSVLSFLAIIYFSRELGGAILGTYFLVMAVVSWTTNLSIAGVLTSVTKRMSEEGQDQFRYFNAGCVLLAITALVLIGGVLVFRSRINAFIGSGVSFFIIALIAVQTAISLLSAGLNGQHKVHIAAMLDPVRQTLAGGIQVVLVFVGYELFGLLFGKVVGLCAAFGIGLYFLSYRYYRPTKETLVDVVSYAKFAWVEGIRLQTYAYLDTLVLAFFVTNAFIGYYQVAFNIASIMALFGISISQTLFPEMSRASSKNDTDLIATLLEDAIAFSGMLLIPGAVGALFLGREILGIYGSGFVVADSILVVLVLSQLLFVYMTQFMNFLNAIDRPDTAFYINIFFATSNLLLNVVLVATVGWFGAAVASLLSTGISLVLVYRAATGFVSLAIPVRELGNQMFATAVMTVYLVVANTSSVAMVVPGPPIAWKLVVVVIGATIYMTALLGVSTRLRTVLCENIPMRLL